MLIEKTLPSHRLPTCGECLDEFYQRLDVFCKKNLARENKSEEARLYMELMKIFHLGMAAFVFSDDDRAAVIK